MPQANLLHKKKLDAFVSWLNAQDIEHRPGRGDFQVLQVYVDGGWHVVYERLNAPEHYSVPRPLLPTVRRFIEESKS